MVRLTDRPDMTLDVYRGRKTTIQHQQQLCCLIHLKFLLFIKKMENLNKVIYFLHCIFSSISIFSILVEFKQQEIINYCLVDLHFIF